MFLKSRRIGQWQWIIECVWCRRDTYPESDNKKGIVMPLTSQCRIRCQRLTNIYSIV